MSEPRVDVLLIKLKRKSEILWEKRKWKFFNEFFLGFQWRRWGVLVFQKIRVPGGRSDICHQLICQFSADQRRGQAVNPCRNAYSQTEFRKWQSAPLRKTSSWKLIRWFVLEGRTNTRKQINYRPKGSCVKKSLINIKAEVFHFWRRNFSSFLLLQTNPRRISIQIWRKCVSNCHGTGAMPIISEICRHYFPFSLLGPLFSSEHPILILIR